MEYEMLMLFERPLIILCDTNIASLTVTKPNLSIQLNWRLRRCLPSHLNNLDIVKTSTCNKLAQCPHSRGGCQCRKFQHILPRCQQMINYQKSCTFDIRSKINGVPPMNFHCHVYVTISIQHYTPSNINLMKINR